MNSRLLHLRCLLQVSYPSTILRVKTAEKPTITWCNFTKRNNIDRQFKQFDGEIDKMHNGLPRKS